VRRCRGAIVCTQSLRGFMRRSRPMPERLRTWSHRRSPQLAAVTHAHYIDNATARRARTRRVIGKVAPDPALRVVGDEPPAQHRQCHCAAQADRERPSSRRRARCVRCGGAAATPSPLRPCTWWRPGNDRSRNRIGSPARKPETPISFRKGPKAFRLSGGGSNDEDRWCERRTRTRTC